MSITKIKCEVSTKHLNNHEEFVVKQAILKAISKMKYEELRNKIVLEKEDQALNSQYLDDESSRTLLTITLNW